MLSRVFFSGSAKKSTKTIGTPAASSRWMTSTDSMDGP